MCLLFCSKHWVKLQTRQTMMAPDSVENLCQCNLIIQIICQKYLHSFIGYYVEKVDCNIAQAIKICSLSTNSI